MNIVRIPASVQVRRIAAAALFAVTLVVLHTQLGGQTPPPDPLQYAGGFLVTGDYAVGSVDLTNPMNPSSGGFSTGTINISGVPANADILAAYLYWETVALTASPLLKRAYSSTVRTSSTRGRPREERHSRIWGPAPRASRPGTSR
jgi:hypothetical protein